MLLRRSLIVLCAIGGWRVHPPRNESRDAGERDRSESLHPVEFTCIVWGVSEPRPARRRGDLREDASGMRPGSDRG